MNLRPSHIRKNSRGIELAVLIGILVESNQMSIDEYRHLIFYGELGLDGRVFEPDDIDCWIPDKAIFTGQLSLTKVPFDRYSIQKVDEVHEPEFIKSNLSCLSVNRCRSVLNMTFSPPMAEVLKVVAAGEHHCLLAGPSGTGKTTFAQKLNHFLERPNRKMVKKIWKDSKSYELERPSFRPLIKPHHTTPTASLIGGGNTPKAGELSRANYGVFVLDEMLEFPSRVLESLREPFEEGCLTVSRGGRIQRYEAKSLFLGTTNLCPCGDYVPDKGIQCSYSAQKCMSYKNRLSGPFLDRFALLVFTEGWLDQRAEPIQGKDIIMEILQAIRWRRKRGQKKPNASLSLNEIEKEIPVWFQGHAVDESFINKAPSQSLSSGPNPIRFRPIRKNSTQSLK